MKKKNSVVLQDSPYYKMSQIDIGQYPQEFWDISETITELSYLTHSYFRYYGKFPSKIGKLIVEDLDIDMRSLRQTILCWTIMPDLVLLW